MHSETPDLSKTEQIMCSGGACRMDDKTGTSQMQPPSQREDIRLRNGREQGVGDGWLLHHN